MNFNLSTRKNLIVLLTLSFIFIFKLILLQRLQGFGWEPDEYMHFLELKTIFTNFPDNLHIGLGVWSKPLYAYPIGLIVSIFNIQSLEAVQVIGILIFLVSSVLVFRILREMGYRFIIAMAGLVLMNFSFLLFRGSLSIMTEGVFALALLIGIFLILKKRYLLASLSIGLLPLVRIEGLLFVAFTFIYFLSIKLPIKQLISKGLVLALPTFAWNLLGFINFGLPLFIFSGGYPLYAGKYGHGGFSYYFKGFIALEPILFIALILGIPLVLKFYREKRKIELFIFTSFWFFFGSQVILWKYGLFGTAGLMRYFITVLPLAILLVCFFLNEVNLRALKKRLNMMIFVLILLIIQTGFSLTIYSRGGIVFYQHITGVMNEDFKIIGEFIKELEDKFIYADIPEVIYYAGRDLNSATIFDVDKYLREQTTGIYILKESFREKNFIETIDTSKVLKTVGEFYIIEY